MKNKKILFVSPFFPFPENYGGSNHRISNFLKALCSEYRVHFISYLESTPPQFDHQNINSIRKINNLCSSDLIIPSNWLWPKSDEKNFNWCYTNYILKKGPYIFREFNTQFLKNIIKLATKVDLIWVERLWIAYHLKQFSNKIIVDIDDLESKIISRQLSTEPINFNTLAKWHDYHKTKKEELEALNTFKKVIVCSKEDSLFWENQQEELKKKIWIIPNGFEDSQLSIPNNSYKSPIAIFIGTLAYPPNIEAILFFSKKVVPLLKQKYKNFEFWIVGRRLNRDLSYYQIDPCIKLFVDVPDVIPYLNKACVSVVPLKVASGTRIKILESLSCGVPVVSTSIGAEGLDLCPDKHFLLAETANDFAIQVGKLFENVDLRNEQIKNSKLFISDKYKWSDIRKKTIKLVNTLFEEEDAS